MIAIDRNRAHEDTGEPIRPAKEWFERAKAAQHTVRPAEFNEGLYGDPEVRASLLELFRYKCAYCESRIEKCEVEHYRPKGRVDGVAAHPGYFWLAYEWSNLFPSCESCNKTFKEKGVFGDHRLGASMGKADQFPLINEATRCLSPNVDITGEARALLDPCQDEPEQHLKFNILGEVVARNSSAIGEASRNVYALDRRPLRRLRQLNLRALKEETNKVPPDSIARQALLSHCQRDDQPYAAFMRCMVADLGLA